MTNPTGVLFSDPQVKPLSTVGQPQAASYLLFFLTGTTTPTNVYADGLLATPLSQTPGAAQPSCTADSAGRFNQIYLDPSIIYRVQLFSAANVKLEDTDPYVPPGIANAATLGQVLNPRTTAEIAASVTPSNFAYPEGDIRRYGATVGASNNSAAITTASTISGAGGRAAFIPGGTWAITSPVIIAPGSSMYGMGTASVIQPANGVNGLQVNATDIGIIPRSRFFRDFQIIGTLSGTTNAAKGFMVNLPVVTGIMSHVLFSNLSILNFQWGFWSEGLDYSIIQGCFIQNCWNGIYFNNQSINVQLRDNVVQLLGVPTLITGPGFSQGISVQGAPEVEGLHISGGSLYSFNYNMIFGLVFELEIIGVDCSFSSMCPINFSATLGGMEIRDCWIELGALTGTFNPGTGAMCGIWIGALTPNVNSKVHIEGNYITCSSASIAGSTGIYLGNSNDGISVMDNQIINFDVGIGGGNDTNNSGGFLHGAQIKYNTINIFGQLSASTVYTASSAALLLNSSSADVEIGPNYIINGAGAAATIAATSTVTVPNQGTAGNAQFPIGSPVQSTAVLSGGPVPGITYYVITSSGAAVTIGATPGGSAIAWTGTGSIGSLIQTPLPLVTTSGLSPQGLKLNARGSFQGTLTGFASPPSGRLDWIAQGGMVSINVDFTVALSATSNATTMAMLGLPPLLLPFKTQQILAAVFDNGTAVYGNMNIAAPAGTVTFHKDPNGTAFTSTGTKGLNTQPLTYLLG